MTDDEERRARRSEALAAARDAGRDDDPPGGEETDRGSEGRERRRQSEERARRSHERRQGGGQQRDNERQQGGSGRQRDNEQERHQQNEQEEQQRTRERRDGSDRHSETEAAVERVSAVDHGAALVTAFEHDGYDCELGRVENGFFGFVRVPSDHDRLHLLWELDVPGEFGYGPDADGWVGFDTRQVDRELSPREAAMALAGLAAQVAERSRSVPN